MVQPGQFLERPTLIPQQGLVLEGLWHRGSRRPALLIVPPLPTEGGSMDHVFAAELAWAVAQVGHPTLRFNFRGVGASQGSFSDAEGLLADADAALTVLAENTTTGPAALVCLAGSAGIGLSLSARRPEVIGLCLVMPCGVLVPTRDGVCVHVIVSEEFSTGASTLETWRAQTGGPVEVLTGADARLTRRLPDLGRSVARWLTALEDARGA